MYIHPELQQDGSLVLNAASHSREELASLESVLKEAECEFTIKAVAPDKLRRMRVRISITPATVRNLQSYLQVTIRGRGVNTEIGFHEKEPTFRCDELTLDGKRGACVDVGGINLDAARVVCALTARARRWLGGVASDGPCKA